MYQVTVFLHTEEPSDLFRVIPCKSKETAIALKDAIKKRFLEENPEIKDNDGTTRITLDDKMSFHVSDYYTPYDFFVDVEDETFIDNQEQFDTVIKELDDDGFLTY
jgi:hypothetical protein